MYLLTNTTSGEDEHAAAANQNEFPVTFSRWTMFSPLEGSRRSRAAHIHQVRCAARRLQIGAQLRGSHPLNTLASQAKD